MPSINRQHFLVTSQYFLGEITESLLGITYSMDHREEDFCPYLLKLIILVWQMYTLTFICHLSRSYTCKCSLQVKNISEVTSQIYKTDAQLHLGMN